MWERSGEAWSDRRFPEVVPHRVPLKAAVAQPTPGDWAFSQGWTWLSTPNPPELPIMGLL